MPRAVLKNGVIYPLEPLPPEWADGQELEVAPVRPVEEGPEAIERWAEEMEAASRRQRPRGRSADASGH